MSIIQYRLANMGPWGPCERPAPGYGGTVAGLD